jgi:hypothetical protein
VAYVVNQVRFDGPSDLLFETRPKATGPEGTLEAGERGFEGMLPGFGNGVLVYQEASESSIRVQAHAGDPFLSFAEFRNQVASGQVSVLTLNPMQSSPC